MRWSVSEYSKALQYYSEYPEVLVEATDDAVLELIRFCETENEKKLLDSMMSDFSKNILNEDEANKYIMQMAREIGQKNYPRDTTAIVAMGFDTEVDGSQEVLNQLKVPLAINKVFFKTTETRFAFIERLHKKGIRHFIVVDDFIGSGKTVRSRYNKFLSWGYNDSSIDFFFLAGMNKAMSFCKNYGIPAHCALKMRKALSGNYEREDLLWRIRAMRSLESKLAPQVGDTLLKDNNFGYNHAEALYCRKYGNIPNSVFPIFWWKQYKDGSPRSPLFVRVQHGY